MWKGDYINLGAGAECGIYCSGFIGDLIQIDGEPIHYEVDRDYVLPMTLKLSLNGVEVYDWQPDEPQWWITGFNPAFKGVQEGDLTAEVTVTFRDEDDPERDAVLEGLWEAFVAEHATAENVDGELIWNLDEGSRTATIVW